jgi:uncharacterized protein (TIGR03000 family)
MYSLVLLMAMTGSAETPDFGRRGGCGCYGGWSGGYCGYYRGGGCYGGWGRCGGWGGYCGYYGGWGGYCGCYGGWGYGCFTPVYSYVGCYGGTIIAPPATTPPPATQQKISLEGAPATLVVELPQDATLTVDNTPTTSTAAVRQFVTPSLAPNLDYTYTLKAQINRTGQTMQATAKVTVRAGQETRVSIGADKFTANVATD